MVAHELDIGQFCILLGNYFSRTALAPTDRLVEDLAFDSLDMTEVMLLLDDAGSDQLESQLVELGVVTVADVFAVFQSRQSTMRGSHSE